METKSGLKYYRKIKRHIKQERMWKNDMQERTVRLFQSGTIQRKKMYVECCNYKIKEIYREDTWWRFLRRDLERDKI